LTPLKRNTLGRRASNEWWLRGVLMRRTPSVKGGVMKTWLLAAALSLAILACGSTARTVQPVATAPASIPATEAIPGGGVRANLAQNGLRFSAEVTGTVVRMYQGTEIAVHLRLTNVGTRPVTWTNLRMWWNASILDPKGAISNLNGEVAWGVHMPGAHLPPPRDTTLAPGESTSTVIAGGPIPGVYTITGGFNADTGPSGESPAIVVTVLPNRTR
jgi:hypothetical protein